MRVHTRSIEHIFCILAWHLCRYCPLARFADEVADLRGSTFVPYLQLLAKVHKQILQRLANVNDCSAWYLDLSCQLDPKTQR